MVLNPVHSTLPYSPSSTGSPNPKVTIQRCGGRWGISGIPLPQVHYFKIALWRYLLYVGHSLNIWKMTSKKDLKLSYLPPKVNGNSTVSPPILEWCMSTLLSFFSCFSINFENFKRHLVDNILKFPKHTLFFFCIFFAKLFSFDKFLPIF